MTTPTRPAVTDTEAADRALLRLPLTVADTQWGRWLIWRGNQRAVDAAHAVYLASLAAVAERRRTCIG